MGESLSVLGMFQEKRTLDNYTLQKASTVQIILIQIEKAHSTKQIFAKCNCTFYKAESMSHTYTHTNNLQVNYFTVKN